MDTVPTPDETIVPSSHRYWQAQSLAQEAMDIFEDATAHDDVAGQRRAFYLLVNYYRRTLYILRAALTEGKEPLTQAALGNLIALHRPLARMHRAAPHTVPLAMVFGKEANDLFVRDLIVRVLSEQAQPATVDEIRQRVNDLKIVSDVRRGTVERHLKNLVASGHATREQGRYARTSRTYTELNLDVRSLQALTTPDLYAALEADDILGLTDVDARQAAFREIFSAQTGMGDATADLFVQAVRTLIDTWPQKVSHWSHADLIGSPYPRPYQYEAYAVFRGGGYQGQVIESPTGSGKTMIGMMCIQDMLGSLRQGQSILVLAPTSNYQQQWIGELCYKPIGLRLSPEVVFSGTPAQLERFKRRTGSHPAVLLVTYTALAQTGSGKGKGGFDADSVEIFLQDANVQHVILDEVHKVVDDMHSVSADVTRLLVEWLEDGSLRSLIGFSGTAEAYRSRFGELGLDLCYNIPLDDLIAYGFVAPFTEFGAPFANSQREKEIRELLDAYKERLRAYLEFLDVERLRGWFAQVPMDERVAIGRDLLSMYHGRANRNQLLAQRMQAWEVGGRSGPGVISLLEIGLVTILQIANGWSDERMVAEAGADPEAFREFVDGFDAIRARLSELIYLPRTLERLSAPDYARAIDADALGRLPEEIRAAPARANRAKDILSATVTGLYQGINDWYRRVGEGRVETIKAVIEAERAIRPISGIIVFDNARRIHWKAGVATPGYEGVGGLFSQMLGDDRFVTVAVLSSEMYLVYDEADPLPDRIAAFVEDEYMRGEVAGAIFSLATQGVSLPPDFVATLHNRYTGLIDQYIPTLVDIRAPRAGEFSRKVLGPIRRAVRKADLGPDGDRLLSRLNIRNVHMKGLVHTFFDYAIIAMHFRTARVAELEQVSGAREKFFVVSMSSGSKKQLMYDLTGRMVDAENLPINLIIVSGWARTGWNVLKPNVLIDATATRNVTAWQQLRGRAMRALRTWTNDCYRLMLMLEGSRSRDFASRAGINEDVARAFEEVAGSGERADAVDERLDALLREIAMPAQVARIEREGVDGLSEEERRALAIALMKTHNKVTHIYELIKSFGSTSQVIYDRQERRWRRRDNIALKHFYETSVHPFSGEKMSGAEHAPLLYAADPRNDLPSELQATIEERVAGCDDVVVAGWLE
jgi:superfamily II DNA or RNA helicase/predicted transcriptional regulator